MFTIIFRHFKRGSDAPIGWVGEAVLQTPFFDFFAGKIRREYGSESIVKI